MTTALCAVTFRPKAHQHTAMDPTAHQHTAMAPVKFPRLTTRLKRNQKMLQYKKLLSSKSEENPSSLFLFINSCWTYILNRIWNKMESIHLINLAPTWLTRRSAATLGKALTFWFNALALSTHYRLRTSSSGSKNQQTLRLIARAQLTICWQLLLLHTKKNKSAIVQKRPHRKWRRQLKSLVRRTCTLSLKSSRMCPIKPSWYLPLLVSALRLLFCF